jgi:hypothetical protein
MKIVSQAAKLLKTSRKTRIKDPEILPLLKKKWKRASPLTKAGIVAAVVVPKVAFLGAGYFMSRQDEKE